MRARRLKKHPVEEKEARVLRGLRKQKVAVGLEDAKKPMIIQAPKAVPSHVSRTEFRKLEEKALKNIVNKEPGSVVFSYETNKVFIKQKSGGVKAFDIMKTDMKKIEEIIKKNYREKNK